MTHPLLYEINTRCWLREVAPAAGAPATLATVPEAELAGWRARGFTHLWLMGVWSGGRRSRAAALKHPGLRQTYARVLPDWQESDVGGSPYAIAGYKVPEALGGTAGLAALRKRLHEHGLKLILDFVPNHVGLDHPWVRERPELFVQAPARQSGTFRCCTRQGVRWMAHGKDPYFPAWTDTVQLDYRLAETRAAKREQLRAVAGQCDGVRCDMAMLVLREVFARTWAHLPPVKHDPADGEFWAEAISDIKSSRPDFLFLAEAYWGMEGKLQSLGFDFAYDKTLYDLICARQYRRVSEHLLAMSERDVARRAHFLENHDEPRVASLLTPAEHRAAALLILGLPGMRFLHEGQLDGAKIHVPVQLLRRPVESPQPEIRVMYEHLLRALRESAVGSGEPGLLRPREAWPGNPTANGFVLVQWQRQPGEFDLVVVNLAPHRAQCYAPVRLDVSEPARWRLADRLGPERYERTSDELRSRGLYLDVPAHAAQLFHFRTAD